MSKRQHRYIKVGLKPADVLCAVDVLMAIGMHEEAIKLLSVSTLNAKGLLEMVNKGASEADRRDVRKLRVVS